MEKNVKRTYEKLRLFSEKFSAEKDKVKDFKWKIWIHRLIDYHAAHQYTRTSCHQKSKPEVNTDWWNNSCRWTENEVFGFVENFENDLNWRN